MGEAIVPLAITLVGAGLSYYSQTQQAAAQDRAAKYNYQLQQQQARIQSEMAQRQAELVEQAARSKAQAQQNNAKALENEASRVEAEARERAKRSREENERLLSAQRARYGAAGVTSEGTPLLIMSESAVQLEQAVTYDMYSAELEQRKFYRQAEMERYEAGFSLVDATAAQYEAAAARYQGQAALQQAELTYWGAKNAANNMRTGAAVNLLADVGTAGYKYYQAQPKTTTVSYQAKR